MLFPPWKDDNNIDYNDNRCNLGQFAETKERGGAGCRAPVPTLDGSTGLCLTQRQAVARPRFPPPPCKFSSLWILTSCVTSFVLEKNRNRFPLSPNWFSASLCSRAAEKRSEPYFSKVDLLETVKWVTKFTPKTNLGPAVSSQRRANSPAAGLRPPRGGFGLLFQTKWLV